MKSEAELKEFVQRLKAVSGDNLQSVVLFGSAAAEEFHEGYSDINLLSVVGELSAATLDQLAPAIRWWTDKGQTAPLIFRRQEIEAAADVFAIEMLDIVRQHRCLYGEDLFSSLQVPLDRHRVQLEHELRTKLLFLRQSYLMAAGDRKKIAALMLDSVSNFIALFRHCLIAMGENPPQGKHQVVEHLAGKLGFEAKPFRDLLEVRQKRRKPDSLDELNTFSTYLQGIEKVIQTVDSL